MKFLLILLLVLFSTITHDIESSKLIKKGHININTTSLQTGEVKIDMVYELHLRWFVPIDTQRGVLTQNLPEIYVQEQGYLELERMGVQVYKDVTLTHLGRWNVTTKGHTYQFCHKILVDKHNGEWSTIAYYHPTVASTGWVRLELTLKIPTIGDYTIKSNLRR